MMMRSQVQKPTTNIQLSIQVQFVAKSRASSTSEVGFREEYRQRNDFRGNILKD